jgi:hypothetical protein
VAGLALSVTVKVPVVVPATVGLKVTSMLQEAPAATLEPHVLVWEKGPLTAMLEMVSVEVPVFSSVTAWALLLTPSAWEAKVKEVGERLAAGPPVPVPVRLTV